MSQGFYYLISVLLKLELIMYSNMIVFYYDGMFMKIKYFELVVTF